MEFLVGQDGLISFLEVNTRLQVEHPVSEETSGIDLVLAQFAIADGEPLRQGEDPPSRGHSIEFRITCEDAGADFLPSQGTITRYRLPTGPGVRIDSGVTEGTVVGGQFDSLLAKLIVTGEDRPQALARARRALTELTIEGLPPVVPFHRLIVTDEAFIGDGSSFDVHTRWIETEWSGGVEPHADAGGTVDRPAQRRSMTFEVEGRRVAVTVIDPPASATDQPRQRRRGRRSRTAPATAKAGDVVAPLGGVVSRLAVAAGADLRAGDLVAVVEAMKMEHAVTATVAGTVAETVVAVGDNVSSGQVLVRITTGPPG